MNLHHISHDGTKFRVVGINLDTREYLPNKSGDLHFVADALARDSGALYSIDCTGAGMMMFDALVGHGISRKQFIRTPPFIGTITR